MTVKYRKIDEASYATLGYSNNVIKGVHQFSGYDLKYEPTIPDNYLHVKIEKYPDSIGLGGGWNPQENIFEEDAGVYAQYNDHFHSTDKYYLIENEKQIFTFFNLYGRYVISFKEYTSDDTLYSTNIMYFEVFDLKRDAITFPFAGEGYEFETTGWSSSLNKSLIALNHEGSNDAKICKSSDTLVASALCEIETKSNDQNDIIYDVIEPDPLKEKNVYGVVLNVYEDCFIWNDGVGGVTNETLYRVGFKGTFVSNELSFATALMLYFDNATKTISDDDSYTYIGKWIDDGNTLIIENDIIGYNTNIDLSASENSMIIKGSSDWEELPSGEENQTLQIKSGAPTWSNNSVIFDEFKNNSGTAIPKGTCVQFGGIYDAAVLFIDENDVSIFDLENGAIPITLNSLDNDKATIKKYTKVGGILGAKTEATPIEFASGMRTRNNIFKSGEDSLTTWCFYVDPGGDLVCQKYNPIEDPSFTDPSIIQIGVSTTGNEFMYDFHYLDNDNGILVTTDMSVKLMNIYYLNKFGVPTTLDTVDISTLDSDLSDISILDRIKITRHDNMFIIYFNYATLESGDYYSGVKCFTIFNIDWLDIGSTIIVYDIIDVIPKAINIPANTAMTTRFNVTPNRSNTDVIVFSAPSVADSKIFIETLIIRDFDDNVIEVDTTTLTETGIENYDISVRDGMKIIKLKENLCILSYVSSDRLYENYIVYCYNDSQDSFMLSDESFITPVGELIDGVNYKSAYPSLNTEPLSEDQFAIMYAMNKESETYYVVRVALGTIINNSSIFWQEMIAPVKWDGSESYLNSSSCFTKPVASDGILFIASQNASFENYITHYEYFKEVENNVIGITQEEIAHEAMGIVGMGGIVEVAASALIPRVNYYCDDVGTITSIPSNNYLGQAMNTSKLIFTPGKK